MARKSVGKKTAKKAAVPAEQAPAPTAGPTAGPQPGGTPDIAKTSVADTSKTTPAAKPMETPKAASKETPKDAPKDPEDTPKGGAKDSPKDAATDAPKDTAKDRSGVPTEDLGTYVSIKPPPPSPRSSAWAGAAVALAVVVGVGIVAMATQDIWRPGLGKVFPGLAPAAEPDSRVAGLVGRMAALESRLRESGDATGSLAKMNAERQQFSEALKTIINRLETVEGQLSDVRQMAEAASGAPTVGAATQSLKEINERLARVEQGGETNAVLDRLAELEKSGGELSEAVKRVDEMQAAGGDPRVVTNTLSVIEGRLTDLESAREKAASEAAANDTRARAVILAVAQLRDTVRRGAPFTDDLEALGKLAAGDTEIAAASATLAGHAATGIPTLAMLRERFDALAGRVVSAARSTPDDKWWRRVANRLGALVSVRRVGAGAAGDTLEAAIARAESLMRGGDLKAAVAEVDAASELLNEPATALLRPWLKSARARLSAERALTALNVKAVALLVPAGG